MNELVSRLVVRLALTLVALALILAGLAFLLAAAYLGLLRVLEPSLAALATAVGALLVALVLVLIARRTGARRRSAYATRTAAGRPLPADLAVGAADLGSVVAAEGARFLAGHAKAAALTALVAGLAVGISPRLRRALWRLLR